MKRILTSLDLNNNKNAKLLFLIILVLVIAAGLYFRFKGLGKWPLAVDEYYIVQSVKNILAHGLPQFPNGGYYDRGLLYQYLTAGLVLTGLKAEFASRIIPVLTNILTVIPLYLLVKKVSGKFLAVTVIFVFCFSVWEVEFARFARMYSPFQMLFIFYLYNLYNVLIEGNRKSLKWLLIISFVSVFIYEGSVFLCILNFIPLVWDNEKKEFNFMVLNKGASNIIYIFLSVIIFIVMYFFIRIDFRTMGASIGSLLPPELLSVYTKTTKEGMFRFPKLLILTLFSYKTFILLFVPVFLFSGFFSYKIIKDTANNLPAKAAFIIIITLSILNLFGLGLVLFILFYLIDWIRKSELKYAVKLIIPPLIINFIFWTIFALKTTQWHTYYPYAYITGSIGTLKILWKGFLNYPYFYETFVLFRDTLPKLTVVLLILLSSGLILTIIDKKKENLPYRILLFIFLFLVLIEDFLNLGHFDTRYFLFLYPLVLILMFISLEKIIFKIFDKFNLQKISFIIFVMLILLVSEDFNINHLVNIDSKEINFRTGFTKVQKIHFYPRWDTRAPAEYINKHLNNSDLVIINEQVNDFYLNRVDVIFKSWKDPDFAGISVDEGKKERWTGAKLIYKYEDFINMLENNRHRKWLIMNTVWGSKFLINNHFFTDFKKYAVYANYDSSAIVYKIPPGTGKGY